MTEIQTVGLNSVETEFSQMPDLLCILFKVCSICLHYCHICPTHITLASTGTILHT